MVEQRQYETRKVALTMLGEIKQVAMSVSRTKSFGSLEIIVTPDKIPLPDPGLV